MGGTPRYLPDEPLPKTPYIPGRGPHPKTLSPKDPGFTLILPPLERCDWSRERGHLLAIDLFNHACFWEAHEAWEELWKRVARFGPEWHALKGLIQLAAHRLKRIQGHEKAARTLASGCMNHFEAAITHARVRGGPVLDLDLLDLASRAEAAIDDRGPWPEIRLVSRPPS